MSETWGTCPKCFRVKLRLFYSKLGLTCHFCFTEDIVEGVIQNVFIERGFGFIRATSGIKYYFRLKSVRNRGPLELIEGQEVTFEDSQERGMETAEDVFVVS